MEHRYSNVEPTGDNINEQADTKAGLTPRELIHRHMNNPDEPIKDEDIENLVLHQNTPAAAPDGPVNTTEDAADNRMLSDEEIKRIEDNSITTPYDILGG